MANNTVLSRDVTTDIPSGSHQIVSENVREIFQWIFYSVLSEAIAILGTMTNIINIICFVKQGFKDVVNISLLGLAISDLGCLVFLVWTNICYNPSFNNLDLPFEPIEFQYLTGAWPHVIFTRVTSWITAFITLERCLCITLPLKVKVILSHKRVKVIIVSIFLVLFANVIPVYYVNRLAWKFSPVRNRTLIGLVFTADRQDVEGITFSISNVFVQLSAFLTVVLCTGILVLKLHMKTEWRQETLTFLQTKAASKRDQKITKMVIVISSFFITCFCPVCLIIIVMIVEPEFSIEGTYRNLFISVCSVGFALEATNSATNTFIYYHMSQKYRTVFRQLFQTCSK